MTSEPEPERDLVPDEGERRSAANRPSSRLAIAVGTALAACVAGVSLAAAAPSATACTAGVSKIGGFTARTFCGPARATVHVGGKTLSFSGGQCAISMGYWTVNIGTIELGQPHKTRSYFGIALIKPSHADGSYPGVSFAFNVPGKSYSVSNATLILRNGGKSASFSGAVTTGGGRVTGSVTCG
jgi:hypothetical protein